MLSFLFFILYIIYNLENIKIALLKCKCGKKEIMSTKTEKEKVFDNIVGITKNQRADGNPSAHIAFRYLRANTDPRITPTGNGRVAFSFPMLISVSEFTEKRLRNALNGMELPKYEDAVSVNVTIFTQPNGGQYEFVSNRLLKGSVIPQGLGTLSRNTYTKDGETRTSLQLIIEPANVSTIQLKDAESGAGGQHQQNQGYSSQSAPTPQGLGTDVNSGFVSDDDLPF